MDLGVVYPRFDTLGGAEKFGVNIMKHWVRDHDVTLYSLSTDKDLLEKYGLDVECVECKSNIPGFKSNTLALTLAVKSMGAQLGDHDAYFMNLFPTHLIDRHPSLWYPQEPSRMLYDLYPHLLAREDLGAHLKAAMRVVFPLLRHLDKGIKSDRIVANSRYSARYLSEVYNRRVSDVVYMGVDEVANKVTQERGDYVLSVNRLMCEKRVQLAIESMRHAPAELTLKVVGEGGYRGRLEKLVLKLGLSERVEFLGRVSEEELRTLYSRALCTIYTPIREPFGLVPLESLAQGTPVIGGLGGGYTEVVEDGVDCFLVDPTPGNIAAKISILWENPDAVKRMGEACLAKAGQYSWGKTADELLKLMLELV